MAALDQSGTGRKVPAQEAERIGLCEKVVAEGEARAAAEELAQEIARFPQMAVRADRAAIIASQTITVREGLEHEWAHGLEAIRHEGVAGAQRFSGGAGRHGDFKTI